MRKTACLIKGTAHICCSIFLMLVILASHGLWLTAMAGNTDNDMMIGIIDLKNRPASEIIPLIRPLLTSGGALTGRGFQLIIKTTHSNLNQLRRLIHRLDKRLQRLVIQVRFRTGSIDRHYGGRLSTSMKTGDRHIRANIFRTEERDNSAHTQQIRTLEGSPAFIQTGQLFPVGQRTIVISGSQVQQTDSIRYKSATTGFYVRAWIRGQRVRLIISPNRQIPAHGQGGMINTMTAGTAIEADLGEWVTIGGTYSNTSQKGSDITYRTDERSQMRGVIQIRVISEK